MRNIWITLRASLVLMVLCGLLYHLVVLGIAQAAMPDQADGSLVYNENNEVIGSKLIGQSFTDPGFFHGRVSSIDYDAGGSGLPNYAPSNPDMLQRTAEAVETWKQDNPDVPVNELPIDLITNSGSGLDPEISPEAARAQIPRVSQATGISGEELERMIRDHTRGRELGFLGEPGVNVMQLNIEVQKAVK
ncbi:potassium-transporting ATPase subunit KdpC [uncultured Paenibacillus sp.]|uniref:potassium-transporting ATPase subunit KdpC n=1 Tax=uncultured Paenibacillus sp. TaxID=227322 RepID=UPI0015B2DEC5|nr:potassium-transporting ATPase subunit KdpC [uncultured Paenibacillus sp.]